MIRKRKNRTCCREAATHHPPKKITYRPNTEPHIPSHYIPSVFTGSFLFGSIFSTARLSDFHRRHHERTVIQDGKRYHGHTSSEHSDSSFAGKCLPIRYFGIVSSLDSLLTFLFPPWEGALEGERQRRCRLTWSRIACSTICPIQFPAFFPSFGSAWPVSISVLFYPADLRTSGHAVSYLLPEDKAQRWFLWRGTANTKKRFLDEPLARALCSVSVSFLSFRL